MIALGQAEGAPHRFAWALGCAALVGFASLAWQILWYRVYAFATGGTLPMFGVYLGIYLAGIAVGALSVRNDCAGRSGEDIAKVARTGAAMAALAGLAAYAHTPLAAWCAERGAVHAALVLVALAAALYGAVLPLVCHAAVAPGERTGRGVAWVYLANIAGSCAGATLTGFVFLEELGTAATSALLLLATAALALALRAGGGGRTLAQTAFAAVTLAGAGLALTAHASLHDALWERLLWKSTDARAHPFAEVVETRAGVVTVTGKGTVFGTGVYDGRLNVGLDTDTNGIYRAYALAGLHPHPRRVALIGMGSGSWAQVIAHHPGVEELTVIEVNPGYLEMIRHQPLVAGLLSNPKVNLVIDDGRRWLASREAPLYDAIVMNTTYHWRARASNLLSRELHALAGDRLAPRGVLYFNTTFSDEAMRTACTSFASGVRIGSFVAVGDSEVEFDIDAFADAVRDYAVEGRPAATDPETWLASVLPRFVDPRHLESCTEILDRTEGVRLITDDNMASETQTPWGAIYHPGPPE